MSRRIRRRAPAAPLPPAGRQAPRSLTRGRFRWIWAVVLAAATLLAYQRVWQAGFIWDDDAHVTRPDLRSWHGLGRIWFEPGATQQYYPLLYSAFWLENQAWGYAALGYHLANVVLHLAAVGLLYRVLRRLALPGSLLAAAAFALHPVCVESVAWISEQKNTLSAVFYFSAALAYLGFDRDRRPSRYVLALALFLLALLTKTVTATLPAALLVVFWWQRGRLSWKRDVLPLVPWLAAGAAAGAVTAWMERTVVGAGGAGALGPAERLLVAGRACWFYLGKLAWPFDLAFIYPRWTIDAREPAQYLYPAAVLGVLAALFALRRRGRGPLAAALLFIGTLFPALGFVDVYPFRFSFVADHFQYLAAAILLSATAALGALAAARAAALRPGAWAAGLLLLGLGFLTWRQAAIYADVGTLWQATIARNPDCWMAYNNLGLAFAADGQVAAAAEQYRRALEINPDFAGAHNNLGIALLAEGRVGEAIGHLQKALELGPKDLESHNSLGMALRRAGRLPEAISQYRAALVLQPDDVATNYNLGNACLQAGDADGAVGCYERALRFSPNYADAHNNLGNAFRRLGRTEEAAAEYRRALAADPGHARARANLESLLAGPPR